MTTETVIILIAIATVGIGGILAIGGVIVYLDGQRRPRHQLDNFSRNDANTLPPTPLPPEPTHSNPNIRWGAEIVSRPSTNIQWGNEENITEEPEYNTQSSSNSDISQCPYCRSIVEPHQSSYSCPDCKTLYHLKCWQDQSEGICQYC